MAERPMLAPARDPDSAAWLDAARNHTLLIGRCAGTGRAFYPPRATSPFTLGPATLEAASGDGTIHAVTVARGETPQASGYVELAEGPRLFTILLAPDPGALRIGQPVRLTFRPAEDGQPVPVFEAL